MPSQVVFFKRTVPALRRLGKHFSLFVVTNQSGVAKGTISMQDVARVNAHIVTRLAQSGISILETYVCPHDRSSGCNCIKPKPYFLKKAEADFGISLKDSFVVGDHPHDVEFATGAGATGIYVLSGHGEKHRAELPADSIVANGLWDAVERILGIRKDKPYTCSP